VALGQAFGASSVLPSTFLHRLVTRGDLIELVAVASSFDVGDFDVGVSLDRTGKRDRWRIAGSHQALRGDTGDRWILVWVGRA